MHSLVDFILWDSSTGITAEQPHLVSGENKPSLLFSFLNLSVLLSLYLSVSHFLFSFALSTNLVLFLFHPFLSVLLFELSFCVFALSFPFFLLNLSSPFLPFVLRSLAFPHTLLLLRKVLPLLSHVPDGCEAGRKWHFSPLLQNHSHTLGSSHQFTKYILLLT